MLKVEAGDLNDNDVNSFGSYLVYAIDYTAHIHKTYFDKIDENSSDLQYYEQDFNLKEVSQNMSTKLDLILKANSMEFLEYLNHISMR